MPSARDVRPGAVAIYIRWSTDEQSDGTSLEVQQERTSLFVYSQGWHVTPGLIFVDDGYSGGSLDRPAMHRLRQAVRAGQVDCVVTYRLDRLSRNLMDTVNLVRQEWAGQCIYRSATEGFDTSDDSPTGALIFNILASFAEFERAVIRERTYNGLVRRMKEGMYISGVVPHGYRRAGKGKLAVKSRAPDGTCTEEAAVVARIFELATGNITCAPAGIAKLLNQQGIPAPGGRQWWDTTVERILSNPIYAGHVVYGRRPAPGPGRGRAARVEVRGAVPAIVTPDQFELAQRILAARPGAKPSGRNRAREDYLLTALAHCPCGGSIAAVRDRHGNLYYRCSRQTKGLCSAGGKAFRAAPVEGRVRELVQARFGGQGQKEGALQWLARECANSCRREDIMHGLKEVEKRRQKVGADLQRLLRQARRGELAAATYEEFRADAERELAELAAQCRRLQAEQAAVAAAGGKVARFEAAIAAADEWDALAPGGRKRLLRLLVRRMTVIGRGRGTVALDVEWAV